MGFRSDAGLLLHLLFGFWVSQVAQIFAVAYLSFLKASLSFLDVLLWDPSGLTSLLSLSSLSGLSGLSGFVAFFCVIFFWQGRSLACSVV